MDENEGKRRVVYYIPDNFISDAKLRIGQISLDGKYLIDMILLGGIGAIIAFLLVFVAFPDSAKSTKAAVITILAAPGIIVGYMGYNGDPISRTISSFFTWKQKNAIKIYNPNPRLLGTDPVKAKTSEETTRDKLVDMYRDYKEKQFEKRQESDLVEGETFQFAYDADVDQYLDDNGDFSSFKNSDGSFDINISGEDIGNNFFFSHDGYNDDDDDEELTMSDFEHN